MAHDEAWFTLTEAARATGKSRVTIRRYLDQERFPHAEREAETGSGSPAPWRIPLGDLVAAGFDVAPADRDPVRQGDTGAISPELARMREQLAVATALASERDRTIAILVEQVTELRSLLTEALTSARTDRGASHNP